MREKRPGEAGRKILVVSDSHGSAWSMVRAIEKERPGLVIFLGDGERDIDEVRSVRPQTTIFAVRGNCDLFSTLPLEIRCAFGGVEIFAAHGHLLGVKRDPGLRTLKAAARKTGAQAALYGHTHTPHLETDEGLVVMNPGAAGGRHGEYGLLWRDEEGRLQAALRSLETE